MESHFKLVVLQSHAFQEPSEIYGLTPEKYACTYYSVFNIKRNTVTLKAIYWLRNLFLDTVRQWKLKYDPCPRIIYFSKSEFMTMSHMNKSYAMNQ